MAGNKKALQLGQQRPPLRKPKGRGILALDYYYSYTINHQYNRIRESGETKTVRYEKCG